MSNRILLAVVLFSVALFSQPQALARSQPTGELQSAHERLLEDPANLDLLYEYAQIAIEQGNFEAAISALEGMLVIARNQPRVLLELGVLYQRLGAPRVAQAYLQRAKAISGAGSTVSTFADEYLGEAEDRISPNVWSGFVKFGLRYQSNPTLSPEVSEILSGGVRIPLPEARKAQSDTNAMLFSRIANRYSLTERTSLASDLVVYGTAYNENSRLDFGLLELTSGILFDSPANASGQYSVRPHVLLRGTRLDHETFEKTAGAGLDFKLRIGADSLFKTTYQFRDVDYEDFNGTDSAPLRSGDEHRLEFNFRTELLRGHAFSVRLFGRTRSAERDFFEEDQYDITLRYSVKFANFLFKDKPRMTLTPYVIRRVRDFGGPDPAIEPAKTRNDREWRAGLTYVVPVAPTWAVYLNLERSKVNSNIVNYDATNNLFMVGLQKGF